MDVTALVDRLIDFLPAEWQTKLKESRKAVDGIIGAILTFLTFFSKFSALIPENIKKPLTVVISLLTAALTYLTPNEPTGA